MKAYNERFKERVDEGLLASLTALPAGSHASIREVVFTKDTRWRWHNGFRCGMTNREVCSVLQTGTHAITHPERTAP